MGDDTRFSPDVKFLAAWVEYLERNERVSSTLNLLIYNELIQLELSVMISIHNIANELAKLKQPSSVVSEEDKEKIANIEKEIVKLAYKAKKWQPLMNNLKEGMERTKRVLRDNR